MVVGTVYDGGYKAFTWSESMGFNYLTPLSGYGSSYAWAVNDKGQVIGNSCFNGYIDRACLWEEDKPVTDIGALPSGEFNSDSRAYDINNNGQVVGSSTSSDGHTHAFRWSKDGGLEDLTEIDDGFIDAYVNAINDSGTMVGERNGRAFIWNKDTGMCDVDVIGQDRYTGIDINNSGQVLGIFGNFSSIGPTFVWQEGVEATFLSALPGGTRGDYIWGNDINNLGQVVGESSRQAFIWDKINGTQSLPLLSEHSGAAYCINDNGVIAGYSYDNAGKMHFVVWTPVPEPSSILALVGGIAGLGGFALRRRRS
jgi:probable HAF family extracellular repeat protein